MHAGWAMLRLLDAKAPRTGAESWAEWKPTTVSLARGRVTPPGRHPSRRVEKLRLKRPYVHTWSVTRTVLFALLVCLVPSSAVAKPRPAVQTFQLATDLGLGGLGDGIGPSARAMFRITHNYGFHVGFGGSASLLTTWRARIAVGASWRLVVGGTVDAAPGQRVRVEMTLDQGFTRHIGRGSSDGGESGARLLLGSRVTVLDLFASSERSGRGVGMYVGWGVGSGPTYDYVSLGPFLELGLAMEFGNFAMARLPGAEWIEDGHQ
jgi:hypothetical protein